MIEMNVPVERDSSAYRVSFDMGNYVPVLKFDTGARYTVISARILYRDVSDEQLRNMTEYCEKNYTKGKEQFLSASGDIICGYPATFHNVKVGDAVLPKFNFYLIPENKRDIALLGYDFIEHCNGSFNMEKNIILTEFNDEAYGAPEGAIEGDELISLIDSLAE